MHVTIGVTRGEPFDYASSNDWISCESSKCEAYGCEIVIRDSPIVFDAWICGNTWSSMGCTRYQQTIFHQTTYILNIEEINNDAIKIHQNLLEHPDSLYDNIGYGFHIISIAPHIKHIRLTI